jgi:hypothetical protein
MQRPRIRYLLAAGAGVLALGGIAVANATNDDRPSVESTSDLADGSTRRFVAGAAGSVEITRTGDTLSVARTAPNAGWVVEVESGAGEEIEVQFTNGASRVDFNAELEDGELRVRVRDGAGGGVSGTAPGSSSPNSSTGTTPNSTPGTTPNSTPGTAPDGFDDDGDDDGIDNSGPGSDDSGHDDSDGDDDDNSGPGGGDDDNSGHDGDDD